MGGAARRIACTGGGEAELLTRTCKSIGVPAHSHNTLNLYTHTQHPLLLANTEQVVNDVAEVNIDAKLLAQRQMAEEDEAYQDTVELENGCACCTAGPDLMDSILKLVRLSLRRDIAYNRIVIEMSGVAGAHSHKFPLLWICLVIRGIKETY